MLPSFVTRFAKPKLRESIEVLPEPLQQFLRTGTAIGVSGKVFTDTSSSSTIRNLILLQLLLRKIHARTTVEVGMAFGASTLVFAHHHNFQGTGDEGRHIAIDPCQDSYWDGVGRRRLEEAGLSRHVRVLTAPSSEALPALLAEGRRIDLAYIDGSHLFEDVFLDFYLLNRLLREGGYLVFDDSTHADVGKVLTFIRRNFSAHYQATNFRTYYRRTWLEGVKYRGMHLLKNNQLTCLQKTGSGQRDGDAVLHNF